MNRAIFLDRDGVLNRAFVRGGKSYPPDRVVDFELLDGVAQACRDLKRAGFLLVVVTNQPDVATGKQSRENVEAMHKKLRGLVPLDDILACFHTDADNCLCRKPKPGMLNEAARRHGIDLTRSFMVGDRWKDIEAGQKAGCRCFFVDYQYKEPAPKKPFEPVAGLHEVATRLLADPGIGTTSQGCETSRQPASGPSEGPEATSHGCEI
ncbi:D,D-heptose 1,7-bisphosphate phosphatase [Sulfidibacter corallicola]|uniref:D,D-heptose 1,7-bisphosphate phosphatase n=1 Tax=Sulfidibacter corallicola TaxID=2818388 RepID=A0A8A4TWH8_SULCO|nr:HAD family hydrolase [Sulfidibacter corallicola]QTD53484.1 HAD family hydrolase [Sulfidibacter corallicola]